MAALAVAKSDQLLAQQLDALLGLLCCQLAGSAERLPVAPQEVAPGSSRPDPGESLVLFLGQHLTTPLTSTADVARCSRRVDPSIAARRRAGKRRGAPAATTRARGPGRARRR